MTEDEIQAEQDRNVAAMRAAIPMFAGLTYRAIAAAYSYWSEEVYCAGWLIVDDYIVEKFKAWIESPEGRLWE